MHWWKMTLIVQIKSFPVFIQQFKSNLDIRKMWLLQLSRRELPQIRQIFSWVLRDDPTRRQIDCRLEVYHATSGAHFETGLAFLINLKTRGVLQCFKYMRVERKKCLLFTNILQVAVIENTYNHLHSNYDSNLQIINCVLL